MTAEQIKSGRLYIVKRGGSKIIVRVIGDRLSTGEWYGVNVKSHRSVHISDAAMFLEDVTPKGY